MSLLLKKIQSSWIPRVDIPISSLMLLAFVLSYFAAPLSSTGEFWDVPLWYGLLIFLIAWLTLLSYRLLLPPFTGTHQWKVWHLVTYTADTSLWILVVTWLIGLEITWVSALHFGWVFWASANLLLVGWFILLNKTDSGTLLAAQLNIKTYAAPKHLSNSYHHQTILITGAAGSIGSELTRQLTQITDGTLLLFDQSEAGLHQLTKTLSPTQATLIPVLGDIRSAVQVNELFKHYQPSIVFHAAAYKQLPILEQYPHAAVATNIVGTKNLVEAAVQYQTPKFIFISTDKAVNPTSILGCTKQIAEDYVKSQLDSCVTTRWAVVRFGNVWNSNGSVLPLWESQLLQRATLDVRNLEASRYFISDSNVAHLLLEIGAMATLDQKYLFSMGKPIAIGALAQRLIRLQQWKFLTRLTINDTTLVAGEKLHETLIDNDEKLVDSSHAEIKIVSSVKEVPFSEHDFEVLLASFEEMEADALKKELHSFVEKG